MLRYRIAWLVSHVIRFFNCYHGKSYLVLVIQSVPHCISPCSQDRKVHSVWHISWCQTTLVCNHDNYAVVLTLRQYDIAFNLLGNYELSVPHCFSPTSQKQQHMQWETHCEQFQMFCIHTHSEFHQFWGILNTHCQILFIFPKLGGIFIFHICK